MHLSRLHHASIPLACCSLQSSRFVVSLSLTLSPPVPEIELDYSIPGVLHKDL